MEIVCSNINYHRGLTPLPYGYVELSLLDIKRTFEPVFKVFAKHFDLNYQDAFMYTESLFRYLGIDFERIEFQYVLYEYYTPGWQHAINQPVLLLSLDNVQITQTDIRYFLSQDFPHYTDVVVTDLYDAVCDSISYMYNMIVKQLKGDLCGQ